MGYSEVKFPENSKFLVTGGAGFIGSNLCEAILNLGYQVRCLDDLSTGKQANVDLFLDNPNYEFIKGGRHGAVFPAVLKCRFSIALITFKERSICLKPRVRTA